jgi:Protein of unknown function (DUF2397)
VAEYIRSRSRYQVPKLGGRLHREAVAILHASDGAREVARELLGQIVLSLERILAILDQGQIDAEALAGLRRERLWKLPSLRWERLRPNGRGSTQPPKPTAGVSSGRSVPTWPPNAIPTPAIHPRLSSRTAR